MKYSYSKKLYDTTKKALAKGKRLINKMSYEEVSNEQNIIDVFDKVSQDYWSHEVIIQCVRLYDKLMDYAEKIKLKKLGEYEQI